MYYIHICSKNLHPLQNEKNPFVVFSAKSHCGKVFSRLFSYHHHHLQGESTESVFQFHFKAGNAAWKWNKHILAVMYSPNSISWGSYLSKYVHKFFLNIFFNPKENSQIFSFSSRRSRTTNFLAILGVGCCYSKRGCTGKDDSLLENIIKY